MMKIIWTKYSLICIWVSRGFDYYYFFFILENRFFCPSWSMNLSSNSKWSDFTPWGKKIKQKNVLRVWDSSLEAYWSPLFNGVEIKKVLGEIFKKSPVLWKTLYLIFQYLRKNYKTKVAFNLMKSENEGGRAEKTLFLYRNIIQNMYVKRCMF